MTIPLKKRGGIKVIVQELRMVFLMDPLERLDIHKDTTYLIIKESAGRGHSLYHMLPENLYSKDGRIFGDIASINIREGEDWFCIGDRIRVELKDMDIIFMREDPPFDMDYLYSTHLLSLIEKDVFIMNNPSGIRKANEKLYSLNFPEIIPESLVTGNLSMLNNFLYEVGGKMVIKPLDSCGGNGVFAVFATDRNRNAILEMMTGQGNDKLLAQRYLPEIRSGDKRLILLDGEPVGAVNRVPADDEHRGNIHVGAQCEKAKVTERDLEIASILAPRLKRDGLFFVGVDLIGGLVTEINVTSPTGIQEINRLNSVKLEKEIVDLVEKMVHQ